MNRNVVVLISFLGALIASFYVGTLVSNYNVVTKDYDATYSEVMDELMENHFSQPSEEDLIQGSILGMITSLDDPLSSYFDYEGYVSYQTGFGESYIGIGVRVEYQDNLIIVQSVTPDGPAENAGIRVNDIIAQVDGIDISDIPFFEVAGMILGEEDSEVTIGIIRIGVEEIISLTMIRSEIESPTVTFDSFEKNGLTIGYIEVSSFGDETLTNYVNAIADLETSGIDGLIIDLRNNGGGRLSTVTMMLQAFLVDDDRAMFSTEAYYDGSFHRLEYFGAQTEKKPYDIVTIVNENSASASEVFASAMQEHGGYTVVGETTYGKGTMQTNIILSTTEFDLDDETTAHDYIKVTIGKWYTTEGHWVDRLGGTEGVTPDLIIDMSVTEKAYKVFLLNDEEILFDTVDIRVVNIQLILNTIGYTLRTDGYFDSLTQSAISEIQTLNSLSVTGNIDSSTLEVLNNILDLYQDNPDNDTQLQTAINYFIND